MLYCVMLRCMPVLLWRVCTFASLTCHEVLEVQMKARLVNPCSRFINGELLPSPYSWFPKPCTCSEAHNESSVVQLKLRNV